MVTSKSYYVVAFLLLNIYVSSEKLSLDRIKYASAKREAIEKSVFVPDVDDSVIEELFERAKRELEHGDKLTHDKRTVGANENLQYHFKKPRDEVVAISRDISLLTRAIDLLSETQNLTRHASEHVMATRSAPRPDFNANILCQQRSFRCDDKSRYRTVDGSCNNLKNPQLGMTIVKLERLLGPKYADDFNTIRKSVTGRDLPLARFVSTTVIPDINSQSNRVTHMIVPFGQFLIHDLVSTPHRTDLTQCCGNSNLECMPIMIPRDDEQLGPQGIGCMEFSRSFKACGTGPREQINQNSAFIDASQVYGSVARTAADLRTNGGFLATSANGLPPVNPNDQACTATNRNFACFVAGDDRVNENPGLMTMHVLFVREHNRIVNGLRRVLGRVNDEVLYQEARRLLIAEMQNIVYSEFLPVILGDRTMNEFNMQLPNDKYTIYEDEINPNIINSFATAAFRYGHSTIQPRFDIGNRESVSVADSFFDPTVIYQAGVTRVLFGATVQNAQNAENFVTSAISRQLFKQRGRNFGLDLPAINIQRGRDHGLPSYNDFREFCGLPRATSFRDLSNFFLDRNAPGAFNEAYEHVDDIDLWPGGVAEAPVNGGMIGPTFACILGIQFNRVMYGDRHFFNHENQAGSFSGEQLVNIRARTFAGIICDNTEMRSLQPKVFQMPSASNSAVDCQNHAKLDFRLFGIN